VFRAASGYQEPPQMLAAACGRSTHSGKGDEAEISTHCLLQDLQPARIHLCKGPPVRALVIAPPLHSPGLRSEVAPWSSTAVPALVFECRAGERGSRRFTKSLPASGGANQDSSSARIAPAAEAATAPQALDA
jgi:hypothetical protein